jgi:nicotinamide-nucleotide amidase
VRIEVLCTGDELLTGLVADTNSPFFMERVLTRLGQKVERATVVGDVREDITGALLELAARCDAVLVSGGLGPTSDDLTAECAAAAAKVPLVEDGDALGWVRERFARLGAVMSPNNARQAMVPQGALAVRNSAGTAPMMVQRLGRCTFFYVPGVPREYRHLVETEVLPRLRELVSGEPSRTFRAFKLLKTVGLAESKLDALVDPLRAAHPRVAFGFRTRAPENHLKLLAEGPTQPEADQALASAAAACRPLIAEWMFAEDDQSFAEAIGALLKARGRTVTLAESCTGGLCAELLTAAPGASEWFVGSAVVYQEQMKQRWVGVSAATLALHGPVSREATVEMAAGARAVGGASYGLAVTGYAGPAGGTAEDPVGTFYYALAGEAETQVQRGRVDGDRERVRQFAAYRALEMLWRAVQGAA